MPNAHNSKGCPLCGKPPSPQSTPFCSQGCKDRDLLRWLDEGYRIAGPTAEQDGLDSEDSDR